ncbi:MAG: hypothetical protein GY906_21130 [bacterium]|nr:hypothetical protein [bacterium]
MFGPNPTPQPETPVRCSVCGDLLQSGEIVCRRCDLGDSSQGSHDVVSFDEVRSLIRRAHYLIVLGVILFPWVLQPWAFTCAARALGKLNKALTQDRRLRRQATIALLASGLLTALYWAALVISLRRIFFWPPLLTG